MMAGVFAIGESVAMQTREKTPFTSTRPNQTRPDGGRKSLLRFWSLQLDEVGCEVRLPVAEAGPRPS